MDKAQATALPIAEPVYGQALLARSLVRKVPAVTAAVTSNQVIRTFHDDPGLNCIAVVDDCNHVIGVLRSLDILRRGTEGFFYELIGRRSCTHLMDPKPLVFDATETLLRMSKAVSELDDKHLVDGFFVTENGIYQGAGRMTDLIKAVTEHQITSARYANPLTMLPGNVPIDQHIQQLLTAQKHFVVSYFDLDNFKPFNDVYGYSAGDDVIRLAGSTMAAGLDEACDFLGHVGGDDFVAVLCSDDWETRIQNILAGFERAVQSHFHPEHIQAGGWVTRNRQGVEVHHGLVCLSAGVVRVAPGDHALPSEISSRLVEAKKQAKLVVGSSYFVDRRAPRR